MSAAQAVSTFDVIAGAIYGAFGVATISANPADESVRQPYALNPSLFTWIMVSEALARHDDPELAWRWLDDQLRLAAWGKPAVHAALQAQFRDCWSGVLPILLLPAPQRRPVLASYQRTFGATQGASIYVLLAALWERYDRNLFHPGDWLADIKGADRYTTPDRACIVKLGLTLKSLAEQAPEDERGLWEAWQLLLKQGVLHRLPDRITRGFAPSAPLLEDVVLSLLAVAEWLSFEQSWRIGPFLNDINARPAERFSPKQKVLAGFLYGWELGYQRVGNLVTCQPQRAVLSRQALRLVLQGDCPEQQAGSCIETLVLHSTAQGALSAFQEPFVELSRYEQHEQVEYDPATRTMQATQNGCVELLLAQQAFAFELALPLVHAATPVSNHLYAPGRYICAGL